MLLKKKKSVMVVGRDGGDHETSLCNGAVRRATAGEEWNGVEWS